MPSSPRACPSPHQIPPHNLTAYVANLTFQVQVMAWVALVRCRTKTLVCLGQRLDRPAHDFRQGFLLASAKYTLINGTHMSLMNVVSFHPRFSPFGGARVFKHSAWLGPPHTGQGAPPSIYRIPAGAKEALRQVDRERSPQVVKPPVRTTRSGRPTGCYHTDVAVGHWLTLVYQHVLSIQNEVKHTHYLLCCLKNQWVGSNCLPPKKSVRGSVSVEELSFGIKFVPPFHKEPMLIKSPR